MKTTIFALTLLAAAPLSVLAAETIGEHQQLQRERIENGIEDGDLTRKESRHLTRDSNQIEAERQAARADGRITRRERRHIRNDQKDLNREIHDQRHDGQER